MTSSSSRLWKKSRIPLTSLGLSSLLSIPHTKTRLPLSPNKSHKKSRKHLSRIRETSVPITAHKQNRSKALHPASPNAAKKSMLGNGPDPPWATIAAPGKRPIHCNTCKVCRRSRSSWAGIRGLRRRHGACGRRGRCLAAVIDPAAQKRGEANRLILSESLWILIHALVAKTWKTKIVRSVRYLSGSWFQSATLQINYAVMSPIFRMQRRGIIRNMRVWRRILTHYWSSLRTVSSWGLNRQRLSISFQDRIAMCSQVSRNYR